MVLAGLLQRLMGNGSVELVGDVLDRVASAVVVRLGLLWLLGLLRLLGREGRLLRRSPHRRDLGREDRSLDSAIRAERRAALLALGLRLRCHLDKLAITSTEPGSIGSAQTEAPAGTTGSDSCSSRKSRAWRRGAPKVDFGQDSRCRGAAQNRQARGGEAGGMTSTVESWRSAVRL